MELLCGRINQSCNGEVWHGARGGTREARGMDAAQEKVRGAAQEGTVQEIVDVVDRIMRHKAQSRTQHRMRRAGHET